MFIRWARLGVWERLLLLAQERGVPLGMTFLDGTSIRAHQKAAGAARKGALQRSGDTREALGRSRGGYGTKACVIADGLGRAVAFILAPGQAHELSSHPAPGTLARAAEMGGGGPRLEQARLKEWRAIATRYEKTASSFMGVLCLAAALDWLEALTGPREVDMKTLMERSRSPLP